MKSNQKLSGINSEIKTGSTFILIKPSGKMLLQLRDDGNGQQIEFPNTWCFPGGSKEEGEDYMDTTVREAKEEFDVIIAKEDCKLLMTYSFPGTFSYHKNYHVFICNVDEKVQPRLQEGDGLRWATFNEIKKINLASSEVEVMVELEKFLKNSYI